MVRNFVGLSGIGVVKTCLVFGSLRPLVWKFSFTIKRHPSQCARKVYLKNSAQSDVAKSTRERCIRVEAIVIVTTVGIWNSGAPSDSKNATTVGRTNIQNKV